MGMLVQDLMKSAPDTPNVVEACNLEGRQERLDGLLSQLEMCEKALQVQLPAALCAAPALIEGLSLHTSCKQGNPGAIKWHPG